MKCFELDMNPVLDQLRARDISAHKGDFGNVLLLCGSVGYTGALALAAMGSLRVSAGLVYLAVPSDIYEIEAVKLNEPVVLPLPSKNGKFSADAIEGVRDLLPRMDAVLVGPGIGRSSAVSLFVRSVLEQYDGPVILDADGIFAVKEHKDILRKRTGVTILTPHEGEFQTFTGQAVSNRMEDAARIAQELGCIILLKGHNTVISDGKSMYINPTGNPGMAVGGSGDLLSGMILGLIAQGLSPYQGAAAGAYIHGLAGDICAAELGKCSMLPTDMLNVLPQILK